MEQLTDNGTDNSDDESIINHVKIIPKKGIKLPKTTVEWNTANKYFKQLNSCENINNIVVEIIFKMQFMITLPKIMELLEESQTT